MCVRVCVTVRVHACVRVRVRVCMTGVKPPPDSTRASSPEKGPPPSTHAPPMTGFSNDWFQREWFQHEWFQHEWLAGA